MASPVYQGVTAFFSPKETIELREYICRTSFANLKGVGQAGCIRKESADIGRRYIGEYIPHAPKGIDVNVGH